MIRVFKTRYFCRWMRKTDLTDKLLIRATNEMARGLVDADLGAGLFKKRIAFPGRGKSGSARVLIATNRGSRWFFVFGFEKNERANISPTELDALQNLAMDLLKLSISELDMQIASGALQEICGDDQN
jgi:hypothetical protein